MNREDGIMDSELIPGDKDAMGRMLLDFQGGKKSAAVQVASSVLEMSGMKGAVMFRTLEQMSLMEHKALDLCQGKVLDAGAGSGCHSLVLQERDMDVTAIDISPGCVKVMERRGVRQVSQESLFSHGGGPYDTILMLMNGMGICGTIEGLNYFFQQVRSLLNHGGQIIADSTDLTSMYTNLPMPPDSEEGYFGETRFSISYGDIETHPFDWLYIDFATLAFYAGFHGWQCDAIIKGDDGKFLARIY